MASGERTNAMWPSRGGRLMVTPASHSRCAGRVNVVDLVGEVAEVAPAGIAGLVPIVGQLDLAALVARDAEEDEREAALGILHSPPFLEAEQLEEPDRRLGIGHPEHGMEELHSYWGLFSRDARPTLSSSARR